MNADVVIRVLGVMEIAHEMEDGFTLHLSWESAVLCIFYPRCIWSGGGEGVCRKDPDTTSSSTPMFYLMKLRPRQGD